MKINLNSSVFTEMNHQLDVDKAQMEMEDFI